MFVFAQETRIRDVSPVLDIYEPVSFVVEKQIMEIDENNNFRGGLLTTRFDIAQYLYRLIKNFKLEQLVVDVGKLKTDSEKFSARFSGLESAYKVTEDRLKQLEAILTTLITKVDELSSDLAAKITKEIQSVLEQLAQMQKFEELFDRISSLEQQMTDLQKQTMDLTNQQQSYQSNLQSLSNKISQLETKHASVVDDLSALKSEVGLLKNNIDEQIATVEKLRKDVETKISISEKLMDDKLSSALGKFDNNLKNLASDLSIQRKEVADLTQNLLGLKGQIDVLQRTISALEINATKQQVLELQALAAEIGKKVEQTNVNLKKMEEKIATMDISALEKRISELEMRQKTIESGIMTAYLLGGISVVVGVLALIMALQ